MALTKATGHRVENAMSLTQHFALRVNEKVFSKSKKKKKSVRKEKEQLRKNSTLVLKGYVGINEGKLCITLLSGPITSPEQKTFSKVALSLSAFPLVLSAEIEFSQLYSSGRLTMFVPSTILIQFWQTKDPVANNDLVENGF